MLLRLLALLRTGNSLTTDEIARRLGVSRPLVEAMLVELEQRGYVQRASEICQSCTGCSAGAGCATNAGTRLWTVRPSASS